jgi:hypothetical protein
LTNSEILREIVSPKRRGDICLGNFISREVIIMANSTRMETVPRCVCYQILESAGCSWERQLELFHSQLAELDGADRSVKLAELVVIEHQRMLDRTT